MSTLIQVMAWYCEAIGPFLNQCWSRFTEIIICNGATIMNVDQDLSRDIVILLSVISQEHQGVSNHSSTRLFVQQDVHKTLKLCIIASLSVKSTGNCWFPSHRVSNAEAVSMWWRHHMKRRYIHIEIAPTKHNELIICNLFYHTCAWDCCPHYPMHTRRHL